MQTRRLVFLALGLLAACAPAGGLRAPDGGIYAPSGIDPHATSEDGLTVGHRLMAAGQYELALDAYLRAGAEQGLTVDTLSALGTANLALGRLGQAEKLLRQAIAKDETFPPAWNNLGVVLMEQGNTGEAERVFRTAFALDSGESADIRENLRLALAKMENPGYDRPEDSEFRLLRRGGGEYLLLTR